MDPQFGCAHYQRYCEVQAPCCQLFYSCKLCHDEKYKGPKAPGCKVQRMQFDKVANIKCMKCSLVQEPSQNCLNPECNVKFGQYTCLKCKLYENNPSKVNDIFHCEDCKMCRRGKRQNFFHCFKCGYCRSIVEKETHKCRSDIVDSDCPICLENLKFSTKYYESLPCGHLIHVECLKLYKQINCPVCGMAIVKMDSSMNKQIDDMIQQTKDNLPEELRGKKVSVLCNECLHKTVEGNFHFYGIKCQKCGSYNTKMI